MFFYDVPSTVETSHTSYIPCKYHKIVSKFYSNPSRILTDPTHGSAPPRLPSPRRDLGQARTSSHQPPTGRDGRRRSHRSTRWVERESHQLRMWVERVIPVWVGLVSSHGNSGVLHQSHPIQTPDHPTLRGANRSHEASWGHPGIDDSEWVELFERVAESCHLCWEGHFLIPYLQVAPCRCDERLQ